MRRVENTPQGSYSGAYLLEPTLPVAYYNITITLLLVL